MAELDLAAIAARADAATPGPWTAITGNGRKNGIGIVGQLAKRGTGEAIAVFAGPDTTTRNADAEFTAYAREDVPALLAAVRAAYEFADEMDCGRAHPSLLGRRLRERLDAATFPYEVGDTR